MPDSSSTLERLVPDLIADRDATGRETLTLHLERYEFAARHISENAAVLDIACGVGYGTRLMADAVPLAKSFLGVDLSEESIRYARQRYETDRVEFVVADAMSFARPGSFDVVVSLETIEHLSQPDLFLGSILASLRPNGVFVGSVPTTPSVDANPHHLHDFTAKSFREMLARQGLREIASLEQVQPFDPVTIVNRKEQRLADMRSHLLAYYVRHPRSLLRRLVSTAVDGFNNKYLTVASRKLA